MEFKWLTSKDNLDDLFAIRFEIYCDEQNYPRDKEQDEHDFTDGLHLAVYDEGKLVGCGRIVKVSDTLWKAGRIAVIKSERGKHIGEKIVNELVDKIHELGGEEIYISAQTHAVGFYEKLGFVPYGIEYFDENIPHVDMKKSIVFDGCEWVEFGDDRDAVCYRKEFSVSSVKSARLRISGLGYFELFFNGKRFNNDLCVPAQTDYEEYPISTLAYPIFDTLSHRIYYMDYDVTSAIKDGRNCMGVHVGNGWYGEHEDRSEGYKQHVGNIKLLYKLEIETVDGERIVIGSKGDDTFVESPVVRAALYAGEEHNLGLYNSKWATVDFDGPVYPCHKVASPKAVIEKQPCTADKVERTIKPVKIVEKDNAVIYDCLENNSGYAVMKFADGTNPGDRITVSYAENLTADGDLDYHSVCKYSTDVYIKGEDDGLLLYPRFTWHAARYIKVEGNGELIEYRVIHTPLEICGEFESSDEKLNWIFDAFKRTMLSNTHGCIPSDCPHRERLGYTGDGQLDSGACMSVFDGREMYKKWIRDILDCQDRTTGHIQHTAPFRGGGGGPGGWGGAICIVPFRYYEYYGDKSVLRECYEPMLAYIRFMEAHSQNGLVTSELDKGWCLGDWCTAPDNKNDLPEPFVNTYFIIKCIDITLKTAEILGNTKDNEYLKNLREMYSYAFRKAYFSGSTHSFIGGIDGADAFAIDIGEGDERTIKNLVKKYDALGHYDTGIFGTDILTRVLFENGHGDLAYKLLTSQDASSFYNMQSHGATTLWENWNGESSHSHPMFGAIVEYFFKYILGIRQTADSYGYEKYIVEPADIPELDFVKGSFRTHTGEVISVEVKQGKKQ